MEDSLSPSAADADGVMHRPEDSIGQSHKDGSIKKFVRPMAQDLTDSKSTQGQKHFPAEPLAAGAGPAEHIGEHISYADTGSGEVGGSYNLPASSSAHDSGRAEITSMNYADDNNQASENRWQAFLYTITIVSFAAMVISAATLTSMGTIAVVFRDTAAYDPSVWAG